MFTTHENGNGIIDLAGLNSLAQTLQLKERGSLLIDILLKKGTRNGVTFKEFREGLLQVITSASEDDGMELTTVVVLVNFTLSLVLCCVAGLSHSPKGPPFLPFLTILVHVLSTVLDLGCSREKVKTCNVVVA